MFQFKTKKPISDKNIIRILLLLVIVLAILAGLYQTAYSNENKKYMLLEDKYVRVRGELGIEKTQELIDQSYQ